MYIPLTCGWIVLFHINCGRMVRLCTKKFFVWPGKNSMYFFMIHYVTIMYIREYRNTYYILSNSIFFALVVCVMTLISMLVYKMIERVIGNYIVYFQNIIKKYVRGK